MVSLYSLLETAPLLLLKLFFLEIDSASFKLLNLFVALSSAIFLISKFLFCAAFLTDKSSLIFDFDLFINPDLGLFMF